MDVNDMLNKAKELAGEHSDQAQEYLGKAEDLVNEKTGGQYSDQVSQGADFVKGQLGLDDQA